MAAHDHGHGPARVPARTRPTAHARPHAHSHGHAHGVAGLRAGARHRRPLAIAFALVVAFLGVQLAVGVATGSLALLSDAGHMATDALGLGMALAAIRLASRGDQRVQRTFGLYRLEILAALANAVLLLGVAGYVLYEAIERLAGTGAPSVSSVPVFVVGVVGLAVNVAAFLLLRAGSKESINVEGAYLEVVSDALGSVGVVIGAVVMWTTGWHWVDPVVGAGIGLFVVPRAWRLGRAAVRVLIQEAPAGVDLDDIAADLSAIDGVADVHDLHLWTLTSEMDVLTAHLMTTEDADFHAVLDRARELLAVRHGIAHATLQVEPASHRGCDDVAW